MGKATVNSHLGAGQYSVDIEYDTRRIALEISRLQSRISQIQGSLAGIEDEIELASANLRIASLTKKLEKLQAIPETETTTAWCADYTEGLTGTVATAEVSKEQEKGVIIRPGYTDSAAWDGPTRGQIQNQWGNTPAAAAFNYAALPGSQLHLPTYRIGTITAIDTGADTCDVTLDTTISRLGQHSVNKFISLSAVPIVYMNCNASAFAIDDRVLIQFMGYSWDSPRVIGFESNPQQCFGNCYIEGEIVSVSGGYEDGDQLLEIKNSSGSIEQVLTCPSDWIEWSVGQSIIAIDFQFCKCSGTVCDGAGSWNIFYELIGLVNGIRDGEGVGMLTLNPLLSDAAERHVDDMIANCIYSHTGSDGTGSLERITDAGYLADSVDYSTGENIANNYDAAGIIADWIGSTEHYENMVKSEYTEAGLSIKAMPCETVTTDTGTSPVPSGTYIAVMTFGWRDPAVFMVSTTIIPMEN